LKSGPVKVETTRNRLFANKLRFIRKQRDGGRFDVEIVDDRAGMIVMRIVGKDSWSLFKHESGGHRWQRIPPNERKGKVHSSTVTVAVFRDVPTAEFRLNENDLEISTCRGSGPGGQHRNKTDSAVQVKHKPTGMIVRCETERSQQQNKHSAIALLTSRLASIQQASAMRSEDDNRRRQIGSGERSDKIRTVQMQNGQVVNNVTGKRMSVEAYMKGDIDSIQ